MNISTGQVEPIFVTVVDAAKILAIGTEDCEQLLQSGRIEWREQFGRISVSLKSLRKYASDILGATA